MARFLHVTFILLVGLYPASLVNAKSIEQMTDEEVASLPKETIGDLPAIDFLVRQDSAWAKEKKQNPDSRRPIFEIEFMLSELKYHPGVPTGTVSGNLMEAVKKYQRKIGANPTGVLLVKQHHQLFLDYSKIKPPAVIPLGQKVVFGTSDIVVAKGTWVFRGDQQAHPIQLSRIECNRTTGICTHSLAVVQNTVQGNYLDLTNETFNITRWSGEEIVAENPAPKCVSYTLTIATRTRDVHQFRRSKGGKDESCKGFAETPLILDLVDSHNVIGPFYRTLENERLGVVNPEYAEQLRIYYSLMDAVGQTERY